MSDSFGIDVTEIKRMAEGLESPKVTKIINLELTNAGQRSARVARDKSNQRIGNKSGKSTGRLADSANVGGTVRNGFTFSTDIVWDAESKGGFHYAKVHHDGRGPVYAKDAKALRFEVGGRVIFAKSVGPAAGTKYAERGLKAAAPNIAAEHQRAADRIGTQIEQGLG